MKIAGIVAEYNPFHSGHRYHIERTREITGADFIVVVMSGDFVQRGEPALFEKHVRAEMALRCGADLVLELPVEAATGSAEFFAAGAVRLLNALGCVDVISFGSEAGEISAFQSVAKILVEEPSEFRRALQESLKKGENFPRAREAALRAYLEIGANLGDGGCGSFSSFLSSPNNILGIEYCKALLRQESSICPVTIPREGNGYHDEALQENRFCSASALRKVILKERKRSDSENPVFPLHEDFQKNFDFFNYVPKEIQEISRYVPEEMRELFLRMIFQKEFLCADDFSTVLHYLLLKMKPTELMAFQDISSDLARRICHQRNLFTGFSNFTELLKTRELTYSRIQRGLLHILLGIPAQGLDELLENPLSYIRILGMKKNAGPLLSAIKEQGKVSLVSSLAKTEKQLRGEALASLERNVTASNLWQSTLSLKNGTKFVHEYTKKMVLL